MALFLRQDDNRTEIQKRVAADLQERLKADKPLEYEKPENSYHDNSHTSKHLGFWVILTGLLLLAFIFMLVSTN